MGRSKGQPGKKKQPPFLTKEAFERLLARAAQPIGKKSPAPEVEKTSEQRRSGG